MKTLYKWTIADYHQIIESGVLDGKSVELLEGEIVTVSPESPLHTTINYSVANYLRTLIGNLAVIRESHPITLDNSPHSRASEPEPDIAIVSIPYTKYISRHPYVSDIYWLIEISNRTLTKDLEAKSLTYARNGIREYWVIDLVNNKLWLFTNPQNNSYQNRQEITKGVVKPVAFPQVKIEVKKLLSVI